MKIVKMMELTNMEGDGILVNPRTINFVCVAHNKQKNVNRLFINFQSGDEVFVRESLVSFQQALEDYNYEFRRKEKGEY